MIEGILKKKTLLLRSKNQLLWEALPKALSLATCVKKKTPKEDQYARNQSKGWGGGLSFVHSKSQLIGHPFQWHITGPMLSHIEKFVPTFS